MSWEGYSQNFCKNGHFFHDLAGYGQEPNECPTCKAPIAICNIVDDTNFDQVGFIPNKVLEPRLITPERFEICNLGHSHIVGEAVYKVPTYEEVEYMRHYFIPSTGQYVPLLNPLKKKKKGK